jgi:hypothetical protein
MLSFIVRLVQAFEREHGMRPNLLYLNDQHITHLKDGFSSDFDLNDIIRMLEMEIVVDDSIAHPHVAWVQMMAQKRAV